MLGRVSIAYAREDKSFVDSLVKELKKYRFDVFYDEDVPGGDNWERRIAQEIRTRDALIVVLTPAAVSSPYVRREIDEASGSRRKVVPVLLRECDSKTVKGLPDIQYIDFRDDKDALPKLVSSLPVAQRPGHRLAWVALASLALLAIAGGLAYQWALRPPLVSPAATSPTVEQVKSEGNPEPTRRASKIQPNDSPAPGTAGKQSAQAQGTLLTLRPPDVAPSTQPDPCARAASQLSAEPRNEGTLAVGVRCSLEARRFPFAIELANRLIDVNGGNADYFRMRGIALRGADQVRAAQADFDKAISLRPDDYQAYLEMGRTLIETTEYQRAATFLEKAVKLSPKNREVNAAMSDAYDGVGNNSLAAEFRRRAAQ